MDLNFWEVAGRVLLETFTLFALLVGFLLQKVVESNFEQPFLQGGIRLLLTAILLVSAEYFDKRTRTLESVTWQDAVIVGRFRFCGRA